MVREGSELVRPRQVRDHVRFPRFSAIIGEGLREFVGIRRDARPNDSHQDGAAAERLLIVELASAVLEFANRRRHAHYARPAIGEIHAPLMGFRVVQEEAQILKVTVWPVGLHFLKLRPAVPNLSYHHRSL